jgi:hypothetical protein
MDEDWEEAVTFVGCDCEHAEDKHGWGCCEVDGCPCSGGWEE